MNSYSVEHVSNQLTTCNVMVLPWPHGFCLDHMVFTLTTWFYLDHMVLPWPHGFALTTWFLPWPHGFTLTTWFYLDHMVLPWPHGLILAFFLNKFNTQDIFRCIGKRKLAHNHSSNFSYFHEYGSSTETNWTDTNIGVVNPIIVTHVTMKQIILEDLLSRKQHKSKDELEILFRSHCNYPFAICKMMRRPVSSQVYYISSLTSSTRLIARLYSGSDSGSKLITWPMRVAVSWSEASVSRRLFTSWKRKKSLYQV